MWTCDVKGRVVRVVSLRFEYSVREDSCPFGITEEIGRREERGQVGRECQIVVVINIFGPEAEELILKQ